LLASQFAALEEPHDALVVNVAQTPAAIVSRIKMEFQL
jgi:gluconate kinase